MATKLISDDTQMTLFTAYASSGSTAAPTITPGISRNRQAYLAWYRTQGARQNRARIALSRT